MDRRDVSGPGGREVEVKRRLRGSGAPGLRRSGAPGPAAPCSGPASFRGIRPLLDKAV